MTTVLRKGAGKRHPSKEDMKIIVDTLGNLGILAPDYTGKLTLHLSEGTIAGIQYDHMIRPR